MKAVTTYIHSRLAPSGYRPYRVAGARKYIFIHINKTGGTSIIKTMWPKHKWHDTAKEIIDMIGEEAYKETYKFAVVRNPWTKAVSQYNFRVQTNQNALGDNPIPFEDWVRLAFLEKDPLYHDDAKMFQPQVEWLKDYQGQINLDRIIRFENLAEEFETVAKELGIRSKLGHRNKSASTDYPGYYNDETKAIIAQAFSEDIETFGYHL